MELSFHYTEFHDDIQYSNSLYFDSNRCSNIRVGLSDDSVRSGGGDGDSMLQQR